MATTSSTTAPAAPRVHWAADISTDSSFSDIDAASGSLAFANAQLVAHGFAHGDGLNLDGLATADAKSVLKAILSLLGQRVGDVERTEGLTANLKTLSYDHQRLQSMHRTAQDAAAQAERDAALHKARAAAVQKSLAASEAQFKGSQAELARTRAALASVRATSAAELKRRDKEAQAFMDRFSRVAETQIKLANTPAGVRAAANADPAPALRAGDSLLEVALRDAEAGRARLAVENEELRGVLLAVANATAARVEYEPLTPVELFSPPTSDLSNAANAHAAIVTLLDALPQREPIPAPAPAPTPAPPADDAELARLRANVASLTTELDDARAGFAVQSQALLNRVAALSTPAAPAEMSCELLSAPEADALRTQLDEQRVQLEAERARFTARASQLGRERAALETERAAFAEEKRAVAVAAALGSLPASPAPAAVIPAAPPSPSPALRKTMPAIPFPSAADALEALLRPALSQPLPLTHAPAPPGPDMERSPRRVKDVVVGAAKKRRSPKKTRPELEFDPLPPPPAPVRTPRVLALRVRHAYSPARPSPLSRILMLADDSALSLSPGVSDVAEEDESDGDKENVHPWPAFSSKGKAPAPVPAPRAALGPALSANVDVPPLTVADVTKPRGLGAGRAAVGKARRVPIVQKGWKG